MIRASITNGPAHPQCFCSMKESIPSISAAGFERVNVTQRKFRSEPAVNALRFDYLGPRIPDGATSYFWDVAATTHGRWHAEGRAPLLTFAVMPGTGSTRKMPQSPDLMIGSRPTLYSKSPVA